MHTIPTVLAALMGLLFDISPAPVPRDGIDLSPATQTSVSMDAELVRIEVHRDHALVHADFRMRNTSDAEESIEVGFPDAAPASSWQVGSKGGTILDCLGPTLEEFSARVDGKAVEAVCKQPPGTRSTTRPEGLYRRWYLWPMTFGARQARRVEVAYKIATKDVNYTPEGILKLRQFAYILKTGKGWKGPIGEARIVVTFADGLTTQHVQKVAPEPSNRTAQQLVWSLERFEPDTDILVQYSVHKDAATALAVFQEKLKETPDDTRLLVDTAVALDAVGRTLDAADTWCHIADRAGEKDRTPSATKKYVPADYMAARLYREAGRPDLARVAAARGVERLERLSKRIQEGYSPGWVLRKMYGTSAEELTRLLKEMREWAEAAGGKARGP